jgi:hypothetical protein
MDSSVTERPTSRIMDGQVGDTLRTETADQHVGYC